MKQKLRDQLFAKVRAEMLGASGKQCDVASSLGLSQKDVSTVKLGRVDTFSTDKLIDIAERCGWSFSFELVRGDGALMAGAVAKGKAGLKKELDGIDFDAMGM